MGAEHRVIHRLDEVAGDPGSDLRNRWQAGKLKPLVLIRPQQRNPHVQHGLYE
jgi:hypothetical protein